MAKEEKNNTFKITLADGTQLTDLEHNGNNFFSTKEVTEETFKGKLGHVVISGDKDADEAGLIGEHGQMELVQLAHYTQKTHGMPDGYYFVLRDIPAAELEMAQLKGTVAYVSMMTGYEL